MKNYKVGLLLVTFLTFSCSNPKTSLTNHVHTYSETYSASETIHWFEATCGHNVIDKVEEHSFGSWYVTEKATEDKEGSQYRICTVCKYKYIEIIPKLEHKHTYSNIYTYDENEHYREATCGHDEVANRGEHTLSDWNIIEEATEDKEGLKRKQCTVCGYYIEEKIGILPHTHKFADEWTKTETMHYYECLCGHLEDKDVGLHDYDGDTCTVCGYVTSEVGLSFELNKDGTYSVIGIGTLKKEKEIIIPSTYENVAVTEIKTNAFSDCTKLETVVVPDSVTTIEIAAFSGCTALESISLPFTGNSINGGNNSHFGYIFGASTVEDNPNYVPTSLKNVTITGNKAIGDNIFKGCSELKYIDVSNAPSIGWEAFGNCSSLENVKLSDNLTSLSSAVFGNCTSLQSIVLPDTVTAMGNSVFSGCSSLKSVVLSNNLTSLGSHLFNMCESLETVTIPENLQSMSFQVFKECKSLKYVYIPNSVTSIGDSAFYKCDNLIIYCEATSQPSGWDSDWNYFNRPVYWGITEEDIIEENGIQYLIINGEAVITRYVGTATEVVIPKSITHNGVAYNVTTIGGYAFSENKTLKAVHIPTTVTTIESIAFYNCLNLTIYYKASSKPSGWEDDWNYSNRPVFWGLTEEDIIEKNGIQYLIINGEAVITRYVGTATEVVTPESITHNGETYNVTSIGLSAFSGCESLKDITIANSIVSIGNSAFSRCSNLVNVKFSNTLTTIGSRAFEYCSSLLSVEIPNSVTTIGDRAFEYCSKLQSAVVSNQVTRIESYTFDECLCLESIELPDTITYIGSYAFYETKLKSLKLPTELAIIGIRCFDKCYALESIELGDKIRSINEGAFRRTGLKTLIIPSSVYYVGYDIVYLSTDITIYCEFTFQPSEWDDKWNEENYPTYWYSETEPTETGNYWHYDENNNVVHW